MKHLKLFFALFAMLALGVGNAWAETGSATITFSNEGLTNSQNVNNKSFALGDYFTVTYTKNSAGTDPTYYTSGSAIRCYATKNTTNGNIITIAQTDKGSEVNAYITKVTYSGDHNKKGKTGFTYSGSPTSSDTNNANYAAADKVTTATATLKETGGSVNGQFYSTGITVEYVYEVSGPPATTYSVTIDSNIENGTVTASPTEAAEGATVTLTATPAANYNFGSWTVKDASDADVAVTGNTFTMPASNVTVSASFVEKSKYTIKWNVAEGSVADTQVYEGNALGTLPTADNCSSGKVFIGWTEATSVNADGSGLVLAKATDVPAGNKEYNAVYVTETSTGGENATNGTATLQYTGTTTTNMATGNNASTVGLDASDWSVVADKGGNSNYPGLNKNGYIPLYYATGGNGNSITVTSNTAVIFDITITYTAKDYNTGVIVVNGETITATSTSDTEATYAINAAAFTISNKNTTNVQVRIKNIEINYVIGGAVISRTDYSLDCETNNDPFLTVSETAFDFGTLAQDENATETFTVTGGYLSEDVSLTISGTNASFFSVSPAKITKADEVEEDVTVTYNPTATGDHTATLTIQTGDITKVITLTGKVLAPGKWVLVKDVATLSAGDEIIIAAAEADYAIGAAASSNYKGAAITKVGETANADTGVTILTVEETGVADAPFAFKTESKYLYAASSSGNQLKAQSTNNANGQWAITITEGVASIVAAISSNRNVMQYNPNNGSPIFACYASASQKALAIYRNSENVVKPVISGEADFVGSTQVTITAQSGLTVYYTTDGTDPNNTSAQYTAPFTINATTTVKAIAYDASSNASGVAEMTFTKHDLVNVATAMALAKDEIAYFDEFEVVKVVTGTQYIYIKDASGHGLIYDLNLATQLSGGDRVQGFVGISAPYGGLPEAKPVDGLTAADLTITSGVAAEPYDFTSTAIAATDINKYIVFNDVAIAANTDVSTNPTLTIGGNSVNLYNKFNISKTLEAGKTYDIYGFVAIYNGTLQVYFYQALEEGEVVTKYTVTYNAGGATGEVPVDENEYTEGAQVYLKSATGLTKEGYDYKGWKVTDESGNEIAVSSNKFNMPASNVTVTAQWEEIVVTPRQDFSAGLWVLVTDASELAANDYIIVAAKDYNVAMVSYDYDVRKNNCGQTDITKFGNNNCFLTWKEEIGVFQLANSGSNFTIQDVNTEEYLYAAGGESSNYLKAADEIPADAEDAKPYIWSITIADGVTTVQATSNGRNLLKYNATNNSGQLFSCYASGQKAIAIYKYTTDFYTRDVTKNNYGTICLPYASSKFAGAEFYEVSSLEVGKGLWLDELAAGTALAAGKPYIFKATADKIVVAYEGAKQGSPVAGVGGLTGTFTNIAANTVLVGHYIIADNKIWIANDQNTLPANRAYIANTVPTTEQPQLPGRRRVCMGENQTTGFDQIVAPKGQTIKAIVNGQLVIIRGGEIYNVQGQKL